MADALLQRFRQNLSLALVSSTEPFLSRLENAEFLAVLESEEVQSLVKSAATSPSTWTDIVFRNLAERLIDRSTGDKLGVYFCIGYAALLAFIQANVTGPQLGFDPTNILLGKNASLSREEVHTAQREMIQGLGVDGIAPYRLIPHVILLCLAEAIMTCPPIVKTFKEARWAKARIYFVQQRLLSETSSTLQNLIYDELDFIESEVLSGAAPESTPVSETQKVEFLIERASIHIHHGLHVLALRDLENAKTVHGFEFAVTGRLGKRTKFQQTDITQLVVLAKSRDVPISATDIEASGQISNSSADMAVANGSDNNPQNLALDDDTLLEAISFTDPANSSATIVDDAGLSPRLAQLDPGNQPQLQSIDSAILLLVASSITNTSPSDGLTREETLPFATRVIDGGSSNFQVYTQALLVRSRIEAYRARTTERGLLQLQLLVDQIIADTTPLESAASITSDTAPATTFLPKAIDSESAPAKERLRYVFQLASPARWQLETELAARWTQLGGLRSALDIYERLEMWAEAALCWAATEREDKANKIIRRQLYHRTAGPSDGPEPNLDSDETWSGPAREPPPPDAPRLYCILGDINRDMDMYEKSWQVSNQRYARAQRSLGRHFIANNDYVRAAEAYGKSLKVDQLNHGSWFAFGCTLLELAQFDRAAEAFSRCVQLDDTDAESWSNLAAALLRRDPRSQELGAGERRELLPDDEDCEPARDESANAQKTKQQQYQEALQALKRASTLKHDSYRIWENVLIVSASLNPPDWASILSAQRQIVQLRGSADGESCIDVDVMEMLIHHVIAMSATYDPSKPGIQRMTVKFVDETIVSMITASAALWRLVSKLAVWRGKPSTALDAEERAWRAVVSRPGWETEKESQWDEVVEATVRLCDAYESLGGQDSSEGLSAGNPVAKDWRFKARSAVRGILGRGKATWEGTSGWDSLKETMENLKI